MALNKRKSTTNRKTVRNHSGGISYSLNDPFTRLRISATSCFFGEPAFYMDGESKSATGNVFRGVQYRKIGDGYGSPLLPLATGKNTRQLMEEAIDACLAVDIERTHQFAVELRKEWFMRATPQVIMVRAALHSNIANT